jgi:hypothetical protein
MGKTVHLASREMGVTADGFAGWEAFSIALVTK